MSARNKCTLYKTTTIFNGSTFAIYNRTDHWLEKILAPNFRADKRFMCRTPKHFFTFFRCALSRKITTPKHKLRKAINHRWKPVLGNLIQSVNLLHQATCSQTNREQFFVRAKRSIREGNPWKPTKRKIVGGNPFDKRVLSL